MKKIILILLSGLSYLNIFSQIDSIPIPKIPNEEYAIYKYDSALQLDILTYQYNLWDIDNDKHKDGIEFISNGGAHSYYHLRIWLSSKKKWIEFPTFEIDLPYPYRIESLTELSEMYPQFVVSDFDNDDVKEIYLNLYNLTSIPTGYGLKSKQILIDYKDDKLKVIDFKK